MRLWCSNYRYMEYQYSSNNILIIDQSYKVHHAHESQSEGMDHQWFQINIIIDKRKITFSLQYITYLLLSYKSSIYSLVCESDYFNNTEITWFPFILMLSDKNGTGSKYQPGCIHDLHQLFTWYLMSIPENGEIILFSKGCFSIESPYFYWVFYQVFC